MSSMKTVPISVEEAALLRAEVVGCPPQDTCGTYPCRHTPCLDLDYVEDLHDMIFSLKHYHQMWWLWHHPEERNTIPASEREIYEAKFNLCQRLKDKLPQIRREIQVHKLRKNGEDERLADLYNYGPFPEVEEATRVYLEELENRKNLK